MQSKRQKAKYICGRKQSILVEFTIIFNFTLKYTLHFLERLAFKKLNYDLLTPRVRGEPAGKVFATMLLYFMIQYNFICNMTMF